MFAVLCEIEVQLADLVLHAASALLDLLLRLAVHRDLLPIHAGARSCLRLAFYDGLLQVLAEGSGVALERNRFQLAASKPSLGNKNKIMFLIV